MATHTYTPSAGTNDGSQFFQDVALSPATLKDGSLAARLNTHDYPQLGISADPAAGRASIALVTVPAGPVVHATSITLRATVVGGDLLQDPLGQVSFYDGATLIVGSATTLVDGVASFVVAGGFTVGTHNLTVRYPGDVNTPAMISSVLALVAT